MYGKNTKKIGDSGEELAAVKLEELGYRIIERNFRTRFGEIDIIAEDKKVLVFVEVKKKSSTKFGAPAEMVTTRKLQKIIKTAESYRIEENKKGPFRVDVVCITGESIEILRNVTSA